MNIFKIIFWKKKRKDLVKVKVFSLWLLDLTGLYFRFFSVNWAAISSGHLLPPYVFNGFLAQLTFHEMDGQSSPPLPHARLNSKNPTAHQQQPAPAIPSKNFCHSFGKLWRGGSKFT